MRPWRGWTPRQAAEPSGLSPSSGGQSERGEMTVITRRTFEALAGSVLIPPSELTGHPWAPPGGAPWGPPGVAGGGTPAELVALETALERYELGVDPELPVRAWPAIAADLDHLARVTNWRVDYAAINQLTPALLGELHSAYMHRPHYRREVLVGLMMAYSSLMWTTKRLGARGLPALAALSAQQCAHALDDPVWLGYAAYLRADATGHLDRALHYRRTLTAAEALTNHLNDLDALQACGMLHLSAALAAGVQTDPDTAATHLAEASALAARMDAEVGRWAHLGFGPPNIGVWATSIALELDEPGQVLQVARTVHTESLPPNRQAIFFAEVGRTLAAERTTREQGIRMLLHAEQLAPQRIRHDIFVREAIAHLLCQAQRETGGRQLRGLARRLGITPIG